MYTVSSAVALIKRTGGMVAEEAVHHNSPGIKVLGAIDYLCSKGFRWYKKGQLVQ